NLTNINHKKTSCIKKSCCMHAFLIIQEVYLFSLLALLSADVGSFLRIDWLKTPQKWLNLGAIITSVPVRLDYVLILSSNIRIIGCIDHVSIILVSHMIKLGGEGVGI